MPRPTFETVDEYLSSMPPPTRAALDRVRATLKKALPRATEGISYQIPVYKIDGAMVLFFAGYARHYAIYPATTRLVRELGDELRPLLKSKTIRFPLDGKVPTALIARIAKVRAAEATDLLLAKPAKKRPAKKRSSSASRSTSPSSPSSSRPRSRTASRSHSRTARRDRSSRKGS